MSSKTTSSRLRHRLTLQQEIQTPDGAGGSSKSWQDVTDLWAEIIPVVSSGKSSRGSSTEQLFAGQVQSEINHRILLRYRDGVTASMRLVFEGRIFNIRYVANTEERRNTLEILAQEGVAT